MPEVELFGWLVSPYTAKVRSMLAYKRIPFKDTEPSLLGLYFSIQRNVGRIIMPTITRPDGNWQQDSALICDELEARQPDLYPTTPPGAAQKLASSLLEFWADEWLVALALHCRWDTPGNAAWAPSEFGRSALPWLPGWASTKLVASFAEKMKSLRSVHGITAETGPGFDRLAAELIGALNTHLKTHRFILGDAACRADFSLYGPLWAHLYRDPHTRHLLDGAPHVLEWFGRLHGHSRDDAFPELPKRAREQAAPTDFLANDAVPPTLKPLFDSMFRDQWPFAAQLSANIDQWVNYTKANGPHKHEYLHASTHAGVKIPRAFEPTGFSVAGAVGSRRQITYQAWRLQRVLDTYSQLDAAGMDAADSWLDGIGALSTFKQIQPEYRLERDNSLPQMQEVVHAVLYTAAGTGRAAQTKSKL